MTPEERKQHAEAIAQRLAMHLADAQLETLIHEIRNALIPTRHRHPTENGPLRMLALADALAAILDDRVKTNALAPKRRGC